MSDRTLTFEELGELGIVHEVNRQLLHPIGLAMARHSDGTVTIIEDDDPEGPAHAACEGCGEPGLSSMVGVLCDRCKQEFLAWRDQKERDRG